MSNPFGDDANNKQREMQAEAERDELRNTIAALRQQLAEARKVPEGWRLVPVEPTDNMLSAGSLAADGFGSPWTRTANAYKAMLSAAPDGEKVANDTLWCIRIPGPDDVHAMASKEAAEQAKIEHDAAITKWYENPSVDKKFLPLLENMLAVVEEWPHDAASHADDLAQQEQP